MSKARAEEVKNISVRAIKTAEFVSYKNIIKALLVICPQKECTAESSAKAFYNEIVNHRNMINSPWTKLVNRADLRPIAVPWLENIMLSLLYSQTVKDTLDRHENEHSNDTIRCLGELAKKSSNRDLKDAVIARLDPNAPADPKKGFSYLEKAMEQMRKSQIFSQERCDTLEDLLPPIYKPSKSESSGSLMSKSETTDNKQKSSGSLLTKSSNRTRIDSDYWKEKASKHNSTASGGHSVH